MATKLFIKLILISIVIFFTNCKSTSGLQDKEQTPAELACLINTLKQESVILNNICEPNVTTILNYFLPYKQDVKSISTINEYSFSRPNKSIELSILIINFETEASAKYFVEIIEENIALMYEKEEYYADSWHIGYNVNNIYLISCRTTLADEFDRMILQIGDNCHSFKFKRIL